MEKTEEIKNTDTFSELNLTIDEDKVVGPEATVIKEFHVNICSVCGDNYTQKNTYMGKDLPKCMKCRNINVNGNDNHFYCGYCNHKVLFYDSEVPEHYFKGKRPYCLHCYQWFFLYDSNCICSVCKAPFKTVYNANTNNTNKQNTLCKKCRNGCEKCHNKNFKYLRFEVCKYLLQKYSNHTPYYFCKSCIPGNKRRP